MRISLAKPLAVIALACSSFGAAATPVVINAPFMNLENRAINSLGFGSGEFLRIGATSVVPNGSAGTTGIGTTTDLTTGLSISRNINFDPGPVIPNFFSRYLADNTSLYGPWTLRFSNQQDVGQATVSLPAGSTQAPFVDSITLSGTSASPTFTWTPPPATRVNGYRINIYDKSLVNNDPNNGPLNTGQVVSKNLLPDSTSYTVVASDFSVRGYAFQFDHNYSIEIGLIQTKDGLSTNLGNANLQAISRVYADFRASETDGGRTVNLPVTLVGGAYKFNFAVVAGQTYYIDPEVAVGYDYATGAGDPNFRSVVLPVGIGDGLYDIFGFDSLHQAILLAHDWLGGSVFDFGSLGVNAFRIGGIEASAGLDPADVTAFVTGLTFVGNGFFTGTQTPLTTTVAAVPEPETVLLILLGLGVVGFNKGFRRRAVRQHLDS